MFFKWILLLVLNTTLCQIAFAQDINDLSGLWKVIDDKSGFTLVKIKISKQDKTSYNGHIVEAFTPPNVSPKDLSALTGFQLLTGLQQDLKNPKNFIKGKVVDPAINQLYEVNGKLNKKGTVLILRNSSDKEKAGRKLSWIRMK
ncbi:DUF2147 domain-containing protein [Acinetobacter sp. ANC 3781]|jgi:hypothetical protein|uniref:DUF2147 domain-containing protein n=1 Tax=Acinetobacter sp. ANC 3781 TaxID=2529835 RepID=UPI00103D537D|nr:DUF2147 domain-containing protein [Acinetobacter sp. ANC 3781]TCB73564.1 DUF2147 domain-containing protein [Acinetobacter sp. ANC 3781]